MKKIITIVLVLGIIFSLAACGDTSMQESKTENLEGKGELGSCYVTIKDYEIMKDYDGKKAIVITYDYTNNSEDANSFAANTIYRAYQNGIELSSTTVYENEKDFKTVEDNSYKTIKPGTTLEVKACFVLDDLKSDVEAEVEEFLGNGTKITKTFNISK